MNAFLYVWNPKRWHWHDLQIAIHDIKNGKPYDIHWSCGNTKQINIGDVFFLMRLGEDPKGIIACGYITSETYLSEHWDEEKAKNGKEALRTDILFNVLSETPIFPLSDLEILYPNYNWTPHSGGMSIPEPMASELFTAIQKKCADSFILPVLDKDIPLYTEGKVKEITTTTYDRSAPARQACIEHHGYDCAVCGFNFKEVYGALGTDYVEVHHLKQIADIGKVYKINPITDLRPVCANCHRMLHKQRPPLSIEELKDMIVLNKQG
jgi:5-methylcytosine-specific restriction protein A